MTDTGGTDREDQDDTTESAPKRDQTDDVAANAAGVAAAYARLGISDAFKTLRFAGVRDSLPNPIADILGPAIWANQQDGASASLFGEISRPIEYDLPDFEVDDSPQRTADATERMAQDLADMHAVTRNLVALTATNLRNTEAQQAATARTERFTRGMTWASLAVAAASLGAAIVAIIVR